MECKKAALDTANKHHKWVVIDRRFTILFSVLTIASALMSVWNGANGHYFVQAIFIGQCFFCRHCLSTHLKDQSTEQWLKFRQEFLDMANNA